MMGKAQSKLESSTDAFVSIKPTSQTATPNPVVTPRLDTDFLLEPPDETSIKRSWTQLSNLIDSHVEVFYDSSDRLSHDRESIRNDLCEFQIVQDPREMEELAGLLHSPRHRKLGLRVCIARAVLSSIDFHGHPKDTSLDPNVVALLGRFNRFRPTLSPEEEAALSHWRMITAFFLAPGSSDLRKGRLPCVDLLIDFLAVYRPVSDAEVDDRDWMGSLKTIAQQGIDVGEKLFCHPSAWSFKWHQEVAEAPQPADYHKVIIQYGNITEISTRIPPPIVLFPALLESLPGDGSQKTGRTNVVQAADIGPGLVFFHGEILPVAALSISRSPLPATSPALHARGTDSTASSASGYGVDEGNHRSRRKRESSRSLPVAAAPKYTEPFPLVRPPRRSSTVDNASPLTTYSGNAYYAESQSTSSRRRKEKSKGTASY